MRFPYVYCNCVCVCDCVTVCLCVRVCLAMNCPKTWKQEEQQQKVEVAERDKPKRFSPYAAASQLKSLISLPPSLSFCFFLSLPFVPRQPRLVFTPKTEANAYHNLFLIGFVFLIYHVHTDVGEIDIECMHVYN